MSVEYGRMRKWLPIAVGVNLLLGIPGIVAIWLVWYMAVNWPLAAIGWTEGNPTENDGIWPWLVLAGPVLLVFVLGWWLINEPIRSRTPLKGWFYWLMSSLLIVVPTLVLMFMGFLQEGN